MNMSTALNDELRRVEKTAAAYVLTKFDAAAKDFRQSATAMRWVALKRSMVVLQAWQQCNRPMNAATYIRFLQKFGALPLSDSDALDDAITYQAHGLTLDRFDFNA